MKFKEGDFVVITANDSKHKQYDKWIGETGVVMEAKKRTRFHVYPYTVKIFLNKQEMNDGWEGRVLRKATKKEAELFEQQWVENEI